MFFSKKAVTPGFENNALRVVPRMNEEVPYGEDQKPYKNPAYLTHNIEEAQVICSDTDPYGMLHKPVIDIDIPIYIMASTTPGHFHLYIDKKIPWGKYCRILEALAEAGIVEPGYVSASKERGFTAVRLPWIKKEKKS